MNRDDDADDDVDLAAKLAARDLSVLDEHPTVYLDTETTGLYGNYCTNGGDEIIEVCIIDDDGVALINSLVRPAMTSWQEAEAINGISTVMVADAPALDALMPDILRAIAGKRVVIYNKQFDVRFFPRGTFDQAHSVECAMLRYARFVGDWNDYRGGWRWWKLVEAAATLEVGHIWNSAPHRALGDTHATRSVWRWLQDPKRQQPQPEHDGYSVPF